MGRKLLLLAAFLAACGGTPSGEYDVPPLEVGKEVITPPGPVKLDVLFVIEHGVWIFEEKAALAEAFSLFVETLGAAGEFDLRVRVISSDAFSDAGKFQYAPAASFPSVTMHLRHWPCELDADCAKQFGDGWSCSPWGHPDLLNSNCSISSSCRRDCSSDEDCCNDFCHTEGCGENETCIAEQCVAPGGGGCLSECGDMGDGSYCRLKPDTAGCPETMPADWSPMEEPELFRCQAVFQHSMSFAASLDQWFRAAWLALDPEGPNAEQSASFLRDEAHLLLVFVGDEDDCSIDEDYCAPSSACQTDEDCPWASECREDEYFSELTGKKKKLCCGFIKKDYGSRCDLLGEFRGSEHHNCFYDLGCIDCGTDADCPEGWTCEQDKKCRPPWDGIFASYQNPPGMPLFSLSQVSDVYARYQSLKGESGMVMVAAISGDGLVKAGDEESFVCGDCLTDPKYDGCQAYLAQKASATPHCLADPSAEGCEELYALKLECIRECFYAARQDYPSGGGSYICDGPYGAQSFGSRFARLVDLFGPNGHFANSCDPEGMEKAMTDIAGMVVSVAK